MMTLSSCYFFVQVPARRAGHLFFFRLLQFGGVEVPCINTVKIFLGPLSYLSRVTIESVLLAVDHPGNTRSSIRLISSYQFVCFG